MCRPAIDAYMQTTDVYRQAIDAYMQTIDVYRQVFV